jgi:alginate O-acetyltransferase complex protein AlgI
MLFNSPLYGIFLVATFIVFWLIRRYRLPRVLFLILASYGFYFYGTYDAAVTQDVPLGPFGWATLCLGVIFVGSSLDFWIGRALGKLENRHARLALLLVSIFYYLGVLSIFKYWNFAADTFADLARALGGRVSPTHLRLVLPFGISFFTFETMSYTIDVYRRELPPADRYLDYLLFVCFFPHLVAGPIVRPRAMLPQFRPVPTADAALQGQGLWLIATGLAKKIVIGDYLAIAMVGRVFDNPERFSALECVFAVYAYAVQIYCDFSGYTDMALGTAHMLGYKLARNFNMPYLAVNVADFWHRWHISLSSWLRDYLFVPLGGSRGTRWQTARNLLITMALGGLWHGAAWTFVVWGVLHGVLLIVHRAFRTFAASRPALCRCLESPPGTVLRVASTFLCVCAGWVVFRATSLKDACSILRHLIKPQAGLAAPLPIDSLVILAGVIALGYFVSASGIQRRLAWRIPGPVWGVGYAGLLTLALLMAPETGKVFIYFQF